MEQAATCHDVEHIKEVIIVYGKTSIAADKPVRGRRCGKMQRSCDVCGDESVVLSESDK